MAVATATPWPAARNSRPRWEMGLGGENGGGEHRRGSGGSQRIHSRRRRGRDGPEPMNRATATGGSEEGKKRRGGALGASGGAWLGEVGRGQSGGACGLVGEAREARWPWWQWTAATSALGHERGESREGRRGRERVRERSEGAAWLHPKRPGRSGKQEVAGAASALATEQLRGEGEEDDRGGGQVGWAGQLGRPGRTVLGQHRS